jgi:hypothetical protein
MHGHSCSFCTSTFIPVSVPHTRLRRILTLHYVTVPVEVSLPVLRLSCGEQCPTGPFCICCGCVTCSGETHFGVGGHSCFTAWSGLLFVGYTRFTRFPVLLLRALDGGSSCVCLRSACLYLCSDALGYLLLPFCALLITLPLSYLPIPWATLPAVKFCCDGLGSSFLHTSEKHPDARRTRCGLGGYLWRLPPLFLFYTPTSAFSLPYPAKGGVSTQAADAYLLSYRYILRCSCPTIYLEAGRRQRFVCSSVCIAAHFLL